MGIHVGSLRDPSWGEGEVVRDCVRFAGQLRGTPFEARDPQRAPPRSAGRCEMNLLSSKPSTFTFSETLRTIRPIADGWSSQGGLARPRRGCRWRKGSRLGSWRLAWGSPGARQGCGPTMVQRWRGGGVPRPESWSYGIGNLGPREIAQLGAHECDVRVP
jgi:hypothetical protein